MDTRSSHRSPRPSSGRRWPSRSSLVVGLVVVLLGTIPVLVPLLVTRASGESAVGPSASVLAAGVPALPRPVTEGEPAPGGPGSPTARTVAPADRAGALAPAAPTVPPATAAPDPTTAGSRSTERASSPAPAGTAPPPSAVPPASDPPPRTLVAGPDLVVVSASWSPGTPAAGDQVTFSAVVRNVGTEATPAVTHGVGFLVDGDTVTWSAGDTAPLAPGEERTYTADAGLTGPTWIAAPGTHSVAAWVDDVDRIAETDEENNLLTGTVEVV